MVALAGAALALVPGTPMLGAVILTILYRGTKQPGEEEYFRRLTHQR